MRAISLWQPWASAVALGSKKIETRHWSTGYRGPLAIHAAKRKVAREFSDFENDGAWIGVFFDILWGGPDRLRDVLPFGAIVGTVDLVDCRPTESIAPDLLDAPHWPLLEAPKELFEWTERQLGDFYPGRFGWVFQNPVAFKRPIPYVGRQGFFDVPDHCFGPEASK